MRYVAGIDIGGTATKLGLFTGQGELVRKLEIPTDTSDHGIRILKAAAEAAEGCIRDVLQEGDDVIGIGIGIPGAVSDGHTVKECINIGWSSEVDVEEQMRRYTQYPVTAINDADAAALGEYWKGSAAGHESVVFVTIGTGVGAGIISHGRLIIGALGYGGEIGHVTVNPFETRICSCGKRGCLELYASAPGIVYEAEKALDSWDGESVLTPLRGRMTAKDIFDAAKGGDGFALSRVDEFGRWMGIGLGSVAQTVDPDVFVIGGGVSRAGEILLDAIRRHYPDWVYGSLKKGRFVSASLGHDAGIYGAAKLMLDKERSLKESPVL